MRGFLQIFRVVIVDVAVVSGLAPDKDEGEHEQDRHEGCEQPAVVDRLDGGDEVVAAVQEGRQQQGEHTAETLSKLGYTQEQIEDMIFASKICKHSKSNAIVLAKNRQLCASGIGQTSRVDALRQAIEKARSFDFDLQGAVMASDAFFPFADCVEIAHEAGVTAVIQPGGSVRDNDSVEYCDKNGMAMVMTGIRHFKH